MKRLKVSLFIIVAALVLASLSLFVVRQSIQYYPPNALACATIRCGGNYTEYNRYRGLPFYGYQQEQIVRERTYEQQSDWIWLGNVLNVVSYALAVSAGLMIIRKMRRQSERTKNRR